MVFGLGSFEPPGEVSAVGLTSSEEWSREGSMSVG